MSRKFSAVSILAIATALAAPAIAHASVTLTNRQGVVAPCIGIGPIGGPAAEHCGQMFEQQGYVRNEALGVSGLTIGVAGAQDGVITKVDAGSAAAKAGLAVGDVIVKVDGHVTKPAPGAIAAQHLFGKKGDKIAVTLRKDGATRNASLVLALQPPPPNVPRWDNVLVANRPMVNWRGDFIPCVSAGVGVLIIGPYCDSHYRKDGYVSTDEIGGSGVQLDMTRLDGAIVSAVTPGSPAAAAGIAPGDEVVAVGGQPLEVGAGQGAKEGLFGKAGDVRQVTVTRGGQEKTVSVTLAATGK